MSQMGQNRKYRLFHVMSAFPPLATELRTLLVVRFVPKSDIDSITVRPLGRQGP